MESLFVWFLPTFHRSKNFVATSACFVAVVKTTDTHVHWGLTGMTVWCVPRPRGGGRCLSLRECTPPIPHRSRWGVIATRSAKAVSWHHAVMWLPTSWEVFSSICFHTSKSHSFTVTFISRVEAFVTGIKIESSDQSPFESWSRWPLNCENQQITNTQLQFDLWTTVNQAI